MSGGMSVCMTECMTGAMTGAMTVGVTAWRYDLKVLLIVILPMACWLISGRLRIGHLLFLKEQFVDLLTLAH